MKKLESLDVHGPQLLRHKKITKRINYFGNGTWEAHHHISVKGLYQKLYFEVFDNAIESINPLSASVAHI